MGEIFLLTRGHIDHVEKWERSMRDIWFPMKFKSKVTTDTGRKMEVEEVQVIDGQLRPIQLWGFVCPDEFIQPVCNSLGIPTEETFFDSTYTMDDGTEHSNNSFMSGKGVKFPLTALRLALGAKKLPEIDLKKGVLTKPIYRNYVNVLGIGYREDGKIKTHLGEHDRI